MELRIKENIRKIQPLNIRANQEKIKSKINSAKPVKTVSSRKSSSNSINSAERTSDIIQKSSKSKKAPESDFPVVEIEVKKTQKPRPDSCIKSETPEKSVTVVSSKPRKPRLKLQPASTPSGQIHDQSSKNLQAEEIQQKMPRPLKIGRHTFVPELDEKLELFSEASEERPSEVL